MLISQHWFARKKWFRKRLLGVWLNSKYVPNIQFLFIVEIAYCWQMCRCVSIDPKLSQPSIIQTTIREFCSFRNTCAHYVYSRHLVRLTLPSVGTRTRRPRRYTTAAWPSKSSSRRTVTKLALRPSRQIIRSTQTSAIRSWSGRQWSVAVSSCTVSSSASMTNTSDNLSSVRRRF